MNKLLSNKSKSTLLRYKYKIQGTFILSINNKIYYTDKGLF